MTSVPKLCPSCRSPLPSDAAFCPRCGVPASGRYTAKPRPTWLVAAAATLAIVAALALVIWRGNAVPRSPAVAAAPTPAAAIPDISKMTPKERFDRLYARIVQALRTGDTLTLDRFAPMALAAYQMLDSTEADSATRRRAAILRLHLGDTTIQLPKPR